MNLLLAIWKHVRPSPAFRPAHLLILALIALGLLARNLGPRPEFFGSPILPTTLGTRSESDPLIDLQAAHTAQSASDRTADLSTAFEAAMQEDKSQEQDVKRQQQAEVGSLHGNHNSKIFHLPGCRNYACKSCTQVFQSYKEALAAGYRPCKLCAP